MGMFVRFAAPIALCAVVAASSPALADYGGPNGYGSTDTYEFDVAHDGYVRGVEPSETTDPTNYVVIDAEDGATEEIDGQTVIVVQEPEPIAATEAAPPPPQTVVVEQSRVVCANGIWVDGYWYYDNGDYLWVDGHCVVERVNYVFVHPRWDYYASIWWFVPGYYRPCGVYVGFGYYRPWDWYPPYYHPYYRGYRPVPVHRAVPRRPTTVRTSPVPRGPTRGAMGRPGYPAGRTSTVQRPPSTRTPVVHRAQPARTPTVNRVTPTRTSTVSRAAPTRTSTVNRVTPTRASTVNRVTPTRAPTVNRVAPTRAATVNRVAPTRTSVITRAPVTRPATVTRVAPSAAPVGIVGRPRPVATRTGGVRGPSAAASSRGTRSSAGVSHRASSGGSGGFGAARSGSWAARVGGSGGFGGGRGGGFGGPSRGGFGGARSVPTARGR